MRKISSKRISLSLFPTLLVLGILLAFSLPGKEAQAACGASVSSCKTCHEVRGEMPVSNAGSWHIDHAFGDFCEACHGGVVSAMGKDEAHQGLRQPLENAKDSCGSCHVTDLEEKAKVYGAVVADQGNDSGGKGNNPGGGVAQPELVPAEQVPEKDLIDYNRQLLEFQGKEKQPLNTVFVLLNIAALLLLFYLIWKHDLQSIAMKASREMAAGREVEGHHDGNVSSEELDCLDSILERPGGEKLVKKLLDAINTAGKGEA